MNLKKVKLRDDFKTPRGPGSPQSPQRQVLFKGKMNVLINQPVNGLGNSYYETKPLQLTQRDQKEVDFLIDSYLKKNQPLTERIQTSEDRNYSNESSKPQYNESIIRENKEKIGFLFKKLDSTLNQAENLSQTQTSFRGNQLNQYQYNINQEDPYYYQTENSSKQNKDNWRGNSLKNQLEQGTKDISKIEQSKQLTSSEPKDVTNSFISSQPNPSYSGENFKPKLSLVKQIDPDTYIEEREKEIDFIYKVKSHRHSTDSTLVLNDYDDDNQKLYTETNEIIKKIKLQKNMNSSFFNENSPYFTKKDDDINPFYSPQYGKTSINYHEQGNRMSPQLGDFSDRIYSQKSNIRKFVRTSDLSIGEIRRKTLEDEKLNDINQLSSSIHRRLQRINDSREGGKYYPTKFDIIGGENILNEQPDATQYHSSHKSQQSIKVLENLADVMLKEKRLLLTKNSLLYNQRQKESAEQEKLDLLSQTDLSSTNDKFSKTRKSIIDVKLPNPQNQLFSTLSVLNTFGSGSSSQSNNLEVQSPKNMLDKHVHQKLSSIIQSPESPKRKKQTIIKHVNGEPSESQISEITPIYPKQRNQKHFTIRVVAPEPISENQPSSSPQLRTQQSLGVQISQKKQVDLNTDSDSDKNSIDLPRNTAAEKEQPPRFFTLNLDNQSFTGSNPILPKIDIQSPQQPAPPLFQTTTNRTQNSDRTERQYQEKSSIPKQQPETLRRTIGTGNTSKTRSKTKQQSEKNIYGHTHDIERFEIGEIIGQGSYATVRQGLDKILNQKVAIKTYDQTRLADQQRIESVHREIDILGKINHPNIIKLRMSIETKIEIHLILENFSQESLKEYLKQQKDSRLTEPDAKTIFGQIVHAIAYCHRNNFVHRDIKLQNILIDSVTQTIKIIDFGFGMKVPNHQKVNFYCGTPSYMAPQIVLKKQYFPRCVDIWALAILLYALLSGRYPFQGRDDDELFRKITKAQVSYPGFFSEGSRSLLERMLRVIAEQRLKTDQDHWFNE